MSKLALHVQHYKAGAVGAIDRHNKRLGDSHSNELIVPERSGDNIAILRPDGDLYKVAREVADNAAGRVTKNSVLVSEWVIYPPEELRDPATAGAEDLQAWGEDVVTWMKDRGLNPKSATIHRDETTNHIHVDTIPLTSDGRLSRKELYTRENLTRYHTELAQYLQERGWNVERGESTEDRQVRSLNVREFKKQQEAARLEAVRLREEAERETRELEGKIADYLEPAQKIENVDQIRQRAKVKKPFLGIGENEVTAKESDFDKLTEQAKYGATYDLRMERMAQENKAWRSEKQRLQERIKNVEHQNNELRVFKTRVEAFLSRFKLLEAFREFQAQQELKKRQEPQRMTIRSKNDEGR